MLDVVLGPTFEAVVPGTVDDAVALLRRWFGSPAFAWSAQSAGTHTTVRPLEVSRHFWSPYLTIKVVERNGETLLLGRFNPNPSIWTGFIGAYLALGTVALGAGMWALAQLMLEQAPLALLFVPACGAVGGALYWVSFLGQRLAADEMTALRTSLLSFVAADVLGAAADAR